MTQTKKYDYRVLKNKQSWTGQILRRVTAKKTRVSKSQKFATEGEAITWAEAELISFSENQNKRNQRESDAREENSKLKAKKQLAMAEKLKQKAIQKAEKQKQLEKTKEGVTPDPGFDNFDDFFEE